mgnify:FL=1|jgi:hypothetical protein
MQSFSTLDGSKKGTKTTIRFTLELSSHAKKRCIQRNINTPKLRRKLLTIPYDDIR